MIQIQELQQIIADNFFNGSMTIAGLLMFGAVLAVILVLFKDKSTAMLLSMPVALAFSILGVIGSDMMILLIIVAVLGLATIAKNKG